MIEKRNGDAGHGVEEGPMALNSQLLCATSEECELEECIELISRGANVNACDDDGCTPLIWAVLAGKSEVVELLLKHGATLDCKDNDGETPLYLAAMTGNLEVARLLIKGGADVNEPDGFGITPLRSAALNDDPEMVELLKKHGARE